MWPLPTLQRVLERSVPHGRHPSSRSREADPHTHTRSNGLEARRPSLTPRSLHPNRPFVDHHPRHLCLAREALPQRSDSTATGASHDLLHATACGPGRPLHMRLYHKPLGASVSNATTLWQWVAHIASPMRAAALPVADGRPACNGGSACSASRRSLGKSA